MDDGIKDLIAEINALEGCVTTSSCAGRISVFLEGKKNALSKEDEAGVQGDEDVGIRETKAGVGGKGGGGRWLFVSHEPVDVDVSGKEGLVEVLGMRRRVGDAGEEVWRGVREMRFVHFKFEPMVCLTLSHQRIFLTNCSNKILHILTASLRQAQTVLSAALQAGFRESGALNLTSAEATPMVGIRSMGLAVESLVGFEEGGEGVCMVDEGMLRMLVEVGNERFGENGRRIERFRGLLRERERERDGRTGDGGGEWEEEGVRRERKRAEGLRVREEKEKEKEAERNAALP